LRQRLRRVTCACDKPTAMRDDENLLLRLEALLISLRDQVDTLTERVDRQLSQN
jgi:hypothetical protein